MFPRTLAILAAVTIASGIARPDDKKGPSEEEVKTARAKLENYLKGIPGTQAARTTALTGDGMGQTFPNHVVFAVIFPQYPVARIAPKPLSSANVVAVPKKEDGKPVPITNEKELEKFFLNDAASAKVLAHAEEETKAWLRALAELNQDGFYKFTVKVGPGVASGETMTVKGEAAVDPQGGNKGAVNATVTFKDGRFAKAESKVDLKPGVRPICQATKLLDPDPIVRGMAEQSILVMGSAAKDYLDEQRAKANPELKKAIDRMWERIKKEGR
ncbi:MAG TPA: hypothetical protein VLM40_02720 [Gemmata sp.]|nr:hypothetical protein [Gemmata sp.]